MKRAAILASAFVPALFGGAALASGSDLFDCRLQARNQFNIRPHQGHLIPGFWDVVNKCVANHVLADSRRDTPKRVIVEVHRKSRDNAIEDRKLAKAEAIHLRAQGREAARAEPAAIPVDATGGSSNSLLADNSRALSFREAWSSCFQATEAVEKISKCSMAIDGTKDKVRLEKLFLHRGNAFRDLGRFDEAVHDYNALLRINPKVAGYYDNRQVAYKSLGRLPEAMSDANSAVQLAPREAFVYYGRGVLWEAMNRPDLGIRDVEHALAIDPLNPGLHVAHGHLLIKTGHNEDAIEELSRVIVTNPGRLDAYKERGLALIQTGDFQKAKSDLQLAASANPDDNDIIVALNNIPAEKNTAPNSQKAVPNPPVPRQQAYVPPAPVVEPPSAKVVAVEKTNMIVPDEREEKQSLISPAANSSPIGSSDAINSNNAGAANGRIADLEAQIKVLTTVLQQQQTLGIEKIDQSSKEATISALNDQINKLKNEYSLIDKNFNTYLTSIRPNDRDLYLTARKASEIYPRIPYYIPGTSESGEFWVEPIVSYKWEVLFNFKFVDHNARIETVRNTIVMTNSEIKEAQQAFLKLHEWSLIAHAEKIRKSYEKRAICFPAEQCPLDGEKADGMSSTEIRFNVYEDGSTAGRIQRNKGRFVEGYNVSIDSAMLLQAYLAYVITEADKEFKAGTQDKKSLDGLFK